MVVMNIGKLFYKCNNNLVWILNLILYQLKLVYIMVIHYCHPIHFKNPKKFHSIFPPNSIIQLNSLNLKYLNYPMKLDYVLKY